jgi:hypothetical protein
MGDQPASRPILVNTLLYLHIHEITRRHILKNVMLILNDARISDLIFDNNVTQERIFYITLEMSVS